MPSAVASPEATPSEKGYEEKELFLTAVIRGVWHAADNPVVAMADVRSRTNLRRPATNTA
jgi:hypothetical protein